MTVTLPSPGAFVWTITAPAAFTIPSSGFMDLTIDETDPNNLSSDGFNHTLRWFINANPIALGSSPANASFGNGTYAFTLDAEVTAIPEPSAIAILIGVSGLVLTRRRRRR